MGIQTMERKDRKIKQERGKERQRVNRQVKENEGEKKKDKIEKKESIFD